MYVQWCIKGICSVQPGGFRKADAFALVSSGEGIVSNWWRAKGVIKPNEVQSVLTEPALDAHVNAYQSVKNHTPFISLAAGFVERDRFLKINRVLPALETALVFATQRGKFPGALFYCWTIVAQEPAIPCSMVSEAIRDTLVYRRWSPYQHQGEITAKIHVPANQIKKVEWHDPSQPLASRISTFRNPRFVKPNALVAERKAI